MKQLHRLGILYQFACLLIMLAMANGLSAAGEPHYFWFFFRDKGPSLQKKEALQRLQDRLSPRVRWRRAKMADNVASLVDETDLPIYSPYVEQLSQLGIGVRTRSKWLNAVAAAATAEQIARAQQLACIKDIRPVLRFYRSMPPTEASLEKTTAVSSGDTLDYGPSFTQNDFIQIPAVHRLGYYGQGVRIAVFDTGFRLNHEAFDSLKVVAQYDFIYGDERTDNEPADDAAQNRHGSQVLSLIAGYAPGRLIGPAFRAEYLLAKTEDTGQEIRAEEDHWVAAAEWADSLGADIITSSLGYNDWYTYADMNGETAAITIAADLAVSKGIVVCTSAGNEGNSSWRYITAPADGKYVLSVGAANADGTIASFSSRGPTADGRIKPDIVAMGVGLTAIAVPPDTENLGASYTRFSGTSASCPMAAGAAALLLCAQPQLNPLQIRQAFWMTATQNDRPDNTFGYGIIQTAAALHYWQMPQPIDQNPKAFYCYTNPFHINSPVPLRLTFNLSCAGIATITLYNRLGQKLAVLWQRPVSAGTQMVFLPDAQRLFQTLGSGVYFLKLESIGVTRWTKITLLH